MEQKKHTCSRVEVERYLLNKMSFDDETLFQEHLVTCRECRLYLQAIRNLSGFAGEGDLQNITSPEKKKDLKTGKRIYYWVSVAAGILLVFGLSFYFLNRQPQDDANRLAGTGVPADTLVTPQEIVLPDQIAEESPSSQHQPAEKEPETETLHDLSITHQHRAATGEADVPLELVFPREAISSYTLGEGTLTFKWNKESAYQLTIKSGDDTLIDVKGKDKQYTVDTEKIASRKSVDWILILDGEERRGRIFLK